MNLRNHEFSIVAVALVGLVLVLIIGGGAIGYITFFGDATPTESEYNSSDPPAVTDQAMLPPGYGPTHISQMKAADIHIAQLDGTAYQYEHYRVTHQSEGKTTRQTLTMTVAATGESQGFVEFDDSTQTAKRLNYYSADGVEFVEQSNESTRWFGNSRFATGADFIQRLLKNATMRTVGTRTEGDETLVVYEWQMANESVEQQGALVVSTEGTVQRLTADTEYADGRRTEEAFEIKPRENVSITRPEWVDTED